jgi:hypothetical protein
MDLHAVQWSIGVGFNNPMGEHWSLLASGIQ